ncbi:hypothetical protein HH212_22950 [Massilia forsythiae]|uniref:Ribbon-helix-helix protein, CopG family n=1 Tax=Massilia forsythiae TaxID=2728020 RepID=A0A7Z2W153_9BURK|nr:hypothetical protein [Massilia forsythiae]QJE02525.1 hypothetical protein HH212_22950 [Massilia forsythiae]
MIEEENSPVETRRVTRKRKTSQAAYARSKSQTEHVLLRLGKGSLALLDAARAKNGLSRSACVEAWLRSKAATREPEEDIVRSTSPSTSIGDEFEALFGGRK